MPKFRISPLGVNMQQGPKNGTPQTMTTSIAPSMTTIRLPPPTGRADEPEAMDIPPAEKKQKLSPALSPADNFKVEPFEN